MVPCDWFCGPRPSKILKYNKLLLLLFYFFNKLANSFFSSPITVKECGNNGSDVFSYLRVRK